MTVSDAVNPVWLPSTEQWLVGGAMWAEQEHVVAAAAVCTPDDFRDETLGRIWAALPYLPVPHVNFVAEELAERGDLGFVGGYERLVELAWSESARLRKAQVWLEAQAEMVHEWGEKRRRLAALSEQAQAVYEGNVTPISAVRINRKSAFAS